MMVGFVFCCIIVYVDVTVDLKASSDGASAAVGGW